MAERKQKPKEKQKSDELKEELFTNLPEIIAGAGIITVSLLLLFFRRQYITSIIGCLAILAIAVEKRGSHFDRIVSEAVIIFLAISFMFL
ncbi:hypothetical protein JXB31_04020 [Candidatus Woesearchaeota archaeon]|nr:hypothetical protein [Candidatus Woesearchaeota archaeon]